jgi:predicted nucleotidyltransferase
MSVVYTWKQVLGREVPEKADYDAVLNEVRVACSVEGAIIAALALGSVVRGDYTPHRSDLDVLVVYHEGKESRAVKCLNALVVLAQERYVALKLIPCDHLIAESRLHFFGPSFMKHLAHSASIGGVLKGDVIEQFAPSVTANEEIESYLRHKLYRLESIHARSAALKEDDKTRFLEKLLEAPIHVARKMLTYCGTPADPDTKREVAQCYEDVMPTQLGEELCELVALDAGYSEELERQLVEPDEDRYRQHLDMIHLNAGRIITFVRHNILHLM